MAEHDFTLVRNHVKRLQPVNGVQSATQGSGAEEYRSHPATRLGFGGSSEWVYLTIKKEGRAIDPTEATILGQCSSFAPLRVHAERISAAHSGTSNVAAILSVLQHMAENGLLLSRGQLMHQVSSLPRLEAPPPISWLAIPTCNRPHVLHRCIQSFRDHFRELDRFPRLLVADDSNTPEACAATKAVVDQAAHSWSAKTVYVGAGEKQMLVSSILKQGGVPRDVLGFGLIGPGNSTKGPGANRNSILLHTLGDLVLSVDDDTICQQFVGRGPMHDRLRLAGEVDPSEYWFFGNRLSALRHAQRAEVDVIAAHQTMLGKTLHALVDTTLNTGADLTSACGHMVRSLWDGSGRIVITTNGAIGDSGMYSGRNIALQRNPGTRNRLLASEQDYRSALHSREILRHSLSPTVSHGTAFISMFFGIDNRVSLPPFFPVGHCDDGVFACVVDRCLEGSYFGSLPWALLHRPENAREYFGRFATTIRISDIAAACIASWPDAGILRTGSSRMSSMGRHLETIASLPEEDFQEYIRFRVWHRVSQQTALRESVIKEYGAKPEFWAADLRKESNLNFAALSENRYYDPVDLTSVDTPLREAQRILFLYGGLLSHWPIIQDAFRREYDVCQ